MIPAAFDYVRAGSAEEAISLLGEHGDEAKLLAGGHSLLPLMKLRLAQPSVLIDIGRLSDLCYIRDAGDHIAIGALTRHHDVENSDVLAEHAPLLRTRPATSATRRCAIAAPSAARSPTPTRPPTCRPRRWRSARRTSPRVRTAPARSPPTTSTRLPHQHARRRRAAHRDPRPEDAGRRVELPEVQPAGPGLGDRRRRGVAAQRRRRRRPRQHGLHADPRHERRVGAAGGASVADAAEQAVAEADPQADLNASVEYRTHLAKVLTRRALEAASSTASDDVPRRLSAGRYCRAW